MVSTMNWDLIKCSQKKKKNCNVWKIFKLRQATSPISIPGWNRSVRRSIVIEAVKSEAKSAKKLENDGKIAGYFKKITKKGCERGFRATEYSTTTVALQYHQAKTVY